LRRKLKKKNLLDFEIEFYENLVRQKPHFVDALIPLAEAYTKKGLYKAGLQIDKMLAQLNPEDPVVHYNLACSYALDGEADLAIETLQTAIKLGYSDFDHLKKDRDLLSLHSDPRFQTLLSSAAKPNA